MLIKHLLELGSLLLVWFEADHFKNTLKRCKVDPKVTVAFVAVMRLQFEDLMEVPAIQFADAWLMVRVVGSGHHCIYSLIFIYD